MHLRHKAISSVSWLLALRYSSRILDLGKYVLITRILTPADLGSFVLATTIVITFEALTDTGFHFAFIQKQTKIAHFAKTLWILSILRGGLISLLILVSAPFLSYFFRSDGLLSLLLIMAAVPFIKGFQSPYVLLFQKDLDFKKEFFFRFIPIASTTLISILFALYLQSPLALVLAVVIGSILETGFSFFITQTTFPYPFSMKHARSLFSFGKYLTLGSIFTLLVSQADSLFVGRVFGTSTLALYELSFKLANTAFSEITDIISRAAFPLFSKIQKDRQRLLRIFKKNMLVVSFPAVVITVLFIFFAEPILTVAFGAEYKSAAPLLQILSVYGFLRAVIGPTGPLFLSVGKPMVTTIMSITNFVVLIILLFPLSRIFGASGVALAMVLSYLIIVPYVLYVTNDIFSKKSFKT